MHIHKCITDTLLCFEKFLVINNIYSECGQMEGVAK